MNELEYFCEIRTERSVEVQGQKIAPTLPPTVTDT